MPLLRPTRGGARGGAQPLTARLGVRKWPQHPARPSGCAELGPGCATAPASVPGALRCLRGAAPWRGAPSGGGGWLGGAEVSPRWCAGRSPATAVLRVLRRAAACCAVLGLDRPRAAPVLRHAAPCWGWTAPVLRLCCAMLRRAGAGPPPCCAYAAPCCAVLGLERRRAARAAPVLRSAATPVRVRAGPCWAVLRPVPGERGPAQRFLFERVMQKPRWHRSPLAMLFSQCHMRHWPARSLVLPRPMWHPRLAVVTLLGATLFGGVYIC